jgi:phage tail sheath protein FI
MALNPTYPGVYIQEISTLPPSIAPLATAVPGFIGYTEKGPKNVPTRLSSMVEFQSIFGGAVPQLLDVTLTTAAVNIAVSFSTSMDPSNELMMLFYHMQMYFGNGGGPCYIISVGHYEDNSFAVTDFTDPNVGIDKAEEADEITLLVVPEAINFTTAGERASIYNQMLAQCNKLQDRFAILDVADTGDISTDASDFRSNDVNANNLKYGAAYYPSLNTVLPLIFSDTDITIIATDPDLPDAVEDFDGLTLDFVLAGDPGNSIPADVALYNRIKQAISARQKLYPCSTMAGIYAAVDRDRGVWKAPANVGVNLVASLGVTINDEEQGGLNVDAVSGKSINAIRKFDGRGTLVWGARTLDGNSNEWRYVNVRRLFINVEESCKKASEFVVFEPNDKNTWLRVKGMINNFLYNIWRDGALAGAKPEDAFFVKVGLGETMSPQDILEGRLIVLVAMAAVRPAEFIVLQFEHKLQVS